MSSFQYLPPTIETVRIVNVNLEKWTVDCISEHGNKRFFEVQVMTPYLHFMNGEGIYVMPEVGCLAWICKPSEGSKAAPFILGFQAGPYAEDGFKSGRQSLNPGDIMMRTRDENFIILRRGGVVQIGATPTAQRIYVPIQNVIRDFCENYQLFTFGGEMVWKTGRNEETTKGDAPTVFEIHAKQKANDPLHVADLSIGSHGEDDPLTMKLVIWTDGTKEREARVQLQITNEGDVTWDLEQSWTLNATQDILMTSAEGNVEITASKAEMKLTSKSHMWQKTEGDMNVSVTGTSQEKVQGTKIIDCATIRLGGLDARNPAVKGLELASLLNSILAVIAGLVCASTGAPIGSAANALLSQVDSIKSSTVFVK